MQPHNIPFNVKRKLPCKNSFDADKIVPQKLTSENFDEFLKWASSELTTVAFDLETTGLDPYTTRPTVIGLSSDGCVVWLLSHEDMQHGPILAAVNNIMSDSRIRKIGHNLKFDMKFMIKHYGTDFNNFDCTMVMRRLLVCGLEGVQSSLEVCAATYLGYRMSKDIREEFIGNTIITAEMLEYAAIDVAATWHLYPILAAYLKIENLEPVYSFIERPLVKVVAEMELHGVCIDREYLKKLEDLLNSKIEHAQLELDLMLRLLKVVEPVERKLKRTEKTVEQLNAGITHVREWPSLNVNSSKQVKEVLNKVGFCLTSAAADVLENPYYNSSSLKAAKLLTGRDVDDEQMLAIGLEVINMVIELRTALKALNAFVIPMQNKFVSPATGKIHSNFNQNAASTGRFTCNDPNFQQMPSERKNYVFNGLSFRRAFVPSPGMQFAVYDYQACELRILAEMSNDAGLLEAIKAVDPRTGKSDPHTPNAAVAYGIKPEEVSKEQRVNIKTCIYTLVYGGGASTVAAALKVPVSEAKKFMDLIFGNFPGINSYISKRKAFARNMGYCTSLSGRKRFFNMPSRESMEEREYNRAMASIERKGQNTPIQATNADITKYAMVLLHDRIKTLGGRLILSIHDELVAEGPIETIEDIYKIMGETMLEAEREFLKTAECAVSGHCGYEWDH